MTLPSLDLNFYKCRVEPILDWGCAHLGCHGTEQGRALRIYARGRLRIAGQVMQGRASCLSDGQTFPSEDCIGSVECQCDWTSHYDIEWQRNFDSARGFALDNMGNPIASGSEDDSELLAQPLIGGGFAHAGIHMFTQSDPKYMEIKAWLSGQMLPSCNTVN